MRCIRPAWRISTYSSRLLPVMARNFTRSSSGLVGSSASSRTRRLNCIQDWSRPLKSLCFFVVLAIEFVHCVVLAVYSVSLAGGQGAGPAGELAVHRKPRRTHSGIHIDPPWREDGG